MLEPGAWWVSTLSLSCIPWPKSMQNEKHTLYHSFLHICIVGKTPGLIPTQILKFFLLSVKLLVVYFFLFYFSVLSILPNEMFSLVNLGREVFREEQPICNRLENLFPGYPGDPSRSCGL